jgi:hypothetical protein
MQTVSQKDALVVAEFLQAENMNTNVERIRISFNCI